MANIRIAFYRAKAQSPFLPLKTFLPKEAWRIILSALKASTAYFCVPSVTHELLWAKAGHMSWQGVLLGKNRALF
jgi:hypothetical protein